MEIDLTRLKTGFDSYIAIDEIYSFSEEYLKQGDLLSLDDVKVKGVIEKDALGELEIRLSIDGVMQLPCAITLKPVFHPFHIDVEGNLKEMLEEIGKNEKKEENTLDILPIIWENILMEIPMRVVSPEALMEEQKLEGEGWKFITEEENKEINPALEKLKDLL